VGEVQPGHVHACANHGGELLLAGGGGADGADDFGAFHICSLLFVQSILGFPIIIQAALEKHNHNNVCFCGEVCGFF
jgi:hypothetical protein